MRRTLIALGLLLSACAIERDLDGPFAAATIADGGAPLDGGGAPLDAGTVDAGTEVQCSSTIEPCGGDPVGRWILDRACGVGLLEAELGASCPGLVATRVDTTPNGRLNFEPDGTFVALQGLTVDADFTTPLRCYGVPCTAAAGVLAASYQADANCVVGESRCDCTFRGIVEVDLDGDYTIVGDTIDLDPRIGEDRALAYCIEGDTMTYAHKGTVFTAHR